MKEEKTKPIGFAEINLEDITETSTTRHTPPTPSFLHEYFSLLQSFRNEEVIRTGSHKTYTGKVLRVPFQFLPMVFYPTSVVQKIHQFAFYLSLSIFMDSNYYLHIPKLRWEMRHDFFRMIKLSEFDTKNFLDSKFKVP